MNENEIDDWRRAASLFETCVKLPPERRRGHLEDTSTPISVREKVASLLAAAESPGLLDDELPVAPADVDFSGREFGGWEVGEEIGRGGMSVVYNATRSGDGFEQQGALKLLSTGLVAHGDVESFSRERMLLAQLSHPNIATMIDGGVAPDGTPYLVMELINGVRIDRYCDSAEASTKARVQLIMQVAAALAHAHRSLIVHRDIKPSNVLVTSSGAVKLVDFGIGRLLDDRRATQTRAFTPGYAAPEQMTGAPVTTATDVFGLGALAHKLLFGAPPKEDFSAAKPKRAHGVDQDLVNVVSMAIRQEPDRRYPNAQAVYEDLQRWCDQRPLVATTDSASYRIRKYLSRHRTAAVAGAVGIALTMAGVAATAWQADKSRNQARAADSAFEFLIDVFRQSDPEVAMGEALSAKEILDQGARQLEGRSAVEPVVKTRLHQALGEIYLSLGSFDVAAEQFDAASSSATDENEKRVAGIGEAEALHRNGEYSDALIRLTALDIEGADDALRGRYERILGSVLTAQANFDEALPHLESALAIHKSASVETRTLIEDYVALADYYGAQTQWPDAVSVLDQALAGLQSSDSVALEGRVRQLRSNAYRSAGELDLALDEIVVARDLLLSIYDERHPTVMYASNEQAKILMERGEHAEAIAVGQEALGTARASLSGHPVTAQLLSTLASVAYMEKDFSEAAEFTAEALAITQARLGDRHPDVVTGKANLAAVYRNVGNYEKAAQLGLEAVTLADEVLEPEHQLRLHARMHYANALRMLDRLEETEVIYREVLSIGEAVLGPTNTVVLGAYASLGSLLLWLDRPQDAADTLNIGLNNARQVYPATSPPVRIMSASLADARLRLGDSEGARPLVEELSATHGSAAEKPMPSVVLLQAQLAAELNQISNAKRLLEQAEELFAMQPDRGDRYRTHVERLKTDLSGV